MKGVLLYAVLQSVYISVKLARYWRLQHPGSLRKQSLRLSFTAGWRHWDVKKQCDWAGRWSSPAAQLHPTSLPSLHRTTLGFASPGYLATWHLAQLRCQATGACNHNTSSWAAHPPALIPPSSVSLIPFFTPEKSALLLLHFIWQLTLHQPLYWSMDYQHILFSPSLSFCLYHSP